MQTVTSPFKYNSIRPTNNKVNPTHSNNCARIQRKQTKPPHLLDRYTSHQRHISCQKPTITHLRQLYSLTNNTKTRYRHRLNNSKNRYRHYYKRCKYNRTHVQAITNPASSRYDTLGRTKPSQHSTNATRAMGRRIQATRFTQRGNKV